jgi:hypothetical protein
MGVTMTGEAAAAVRAELEREEEFLLDLTRQLVRIPTVNPKFEADAALNTPLGHGWCAPLSIPARRKARTPRSGVLPQCATRRTMPPPAFPA